MGGSAQQIPAIIAARRLGYSPVLCDYLPDNPGQFHADTYYGVSTTDQDEVLKVAKREQVAGVVAYASDPAALTAAYVADKMGLPGNPYSSIEILSHKDKYREFMARRNFSTPLAHGYSSIVEASRDIGRFKMPVVIKPVDSSGSKGVSILKRPEDLPEQAGSALSYSRCQRLIIEEFIEQKGYQVAGDGFVVDGQLVFRCFGNDHFDLSNPNPLVPVAASFPYIGTQRLQNKIHNEIQRLLSLLNIRVGAFNFDIRIDVDENVYLMEVGPRNGGNYIPQVIRYATGVDLVDYTIKAAMGEDCSDIRMKKVQGYWAYYALHSNRSGVLKDIRIAEEIESRQLVERNLIYKRGDRIPAFMSSSTAIGILIMKFGSQQEMLNMMDCPEQWLKLIVV